ncbi:MAG: PDZ domain-containing protein [Chloroflexota bacterium]
MTKKRILTVGAIVIVVAALSGLIFGAVSADEDERPSKDGVLVIDVQEGSPADQAGLERGDIILKINDQEVNTAADIVSIVRDLEIGDELAVQVRHGGEIKIISLVLEDSEQGYPQMGVMLERGLAARVSRFVGRAPDGMRGMALFIRPSIDTPGALVVKVVEDSPAESAGIQPRDLIISFDGDPIENYGDLVRTVRSYQPGDTVQITLVRGEDEISFEVELGSTSKGEDEGTAFLGVVVYPVAGPQQLEWRKLPVPGDWMHCEEDDCEGEPFRERLREFFDYDDEWRPMPPVMERFLHQRRFRIPLPMPHPFDQPEDGGPSGWWHFDRWKFSNAPDDSRGLVNPGSRMDTNNDKSGQGQNQSKSGA